MVIRSIKLLVKNYSTVKKDVPARAYRKYLKFGAIMVGGGLLSYGTYGTIFKLI
jgi:hypothetical protein